jgi:hypothetical protein
MMVGVQTDDERVERAQTHALELGRRLRVEPDPDTGNFLAYAGRANEERATGRFLAYGESRGAAAENGLAVLRDIIERDVPWPRR